MLAKHLLGELRSSAIEIDECFTKIIDHFGNVQTYADEEDAWREKDDDVHCAAGELKQPIEIEPNDNVHFIGQGQADVKRITKGR